MPYLIRTALGPSHWAPYLINGDSSGMTDAEIAEATAWLKKLGNGAPVSCEAWGIGYFNGLKCDLEDYSFLVETDNPLFKVWS